MDGEKPGVVIGRNVRALREAGMFTRRELAERSGLSEQGLTHLEMGMSKRPRRRTIERVARGLGVEVKTLLEGVETEAPKAEAPPSQRSLFNGFEEDQRRQEEGSSIADDKRWLAMQLRRGNLTRLQIAGVSVDPEDLPDEVVAFLARDLRQLFQTTDITLGDRIESIIRIHLESGEELVMSAWCEVA